MAAALPAETAATSLQDSKLPYRSIMAFLTAGGAPRRIFSASIAASAAEKGVTDENG
jgi:hypothetical protein